MILFLIFYVKGLHIRTSKTFFRIFCDTRAYTAPNEEAARKAGLSSGVSVGGEDGCRFLSIRRERGNGYAEQ